MGGKREEKMNVYRSGQPGIKPSSESGFFVCDSVLRWEISLVVGEGEGRLKAESWWKKLPLRWKVEVLFFASFAKCREEGTAFWWPSDWTRRNR